MSEEKDPNGLRPHDRGAKLDAGKPRPTLVFFGFPRALAAVTEVATAGAEKYTDDGWLHVPDGQGRYTDAMLRHLLAEAREEAEDPASGSLHAAHVVWNALARLELMLRDEENKGLLLREAP